LPLKWLSRLALVGRTLGRDCGWLVMPAIGEIL
jgi:hypothetical protein